VAKRAKAKGVEKEMNRKIISLHIDLFKKLSQERQRLEAFESKFWPDGTYKSGLYKQSSNTENNRKLKWWVTPFVFISVCITLSFLIPWSIYRIIRVQVVEAAFHKIVRHVETLRKG